MSTSSTTPLRTIRHSLSELEDLLQIQVELLATNPNSFAYQLSIRSLELRREELLRARAALLSQRGTERVELHFHPPLELAPLRLIGGALAEFQSMLDSLGRALQYGPVYIGLIPRESTERTAVGIAGVNPGSVAVVVQGPTEPNLYGESLLASSIESLFSLLDAGADSGKLLGMVGEVGERSLSHYAQWARMISDEKAAITVKWRDLEDNDREWQASSAKLIEVQAALARIKEEGKHEEEVVGLLQTASLSHGHFVLVSEPGRKAISGKVPIELYPLINEFLGKHCRARIVVQVVNDGAADRRENRTLIRISAP